MTTLDTYHALDKIADYALGLLPAEERERVETHIVNCLTCRQAYEQERRFALAIRQTLHKTTRPEPARLAGLRPAIPVRTSRVAQTSFRYLLPVSLIALLFALGLFIQMAGWSPLNSTFAPNHTATASRPTQTATATNTPTATLASVTTLNDTTASKSREPSTNIRYANALETPVQAPTAGQALSLMTTNLDAHPVHDTSSPIPNSTPEGMAVP